jgi:tRNA-2-methylthio-N6-dimethylallyladenosine synthase
MKLPNLDEARKRTKSEIEFITLDQNYDANTFKNQKYFLRTYGCQMNVHDGEEIAARLETLGFTSTEELTEADIVILNISLCVLIISLLLFYIYIISIQVEKTQLL